MKLSRVSVVLVWVVAVLFQSTVYGDPHQPQQVHLSFGDDPTKMIVVWNTPEPTPNASVEYGQLSSASRYANATMTKFVDGGSLHHVQYIYRATMTGLVPGTKYYYRCGSKYRKSKVFSFSAMRNGTDWSPRILLFGDLGVLNGRSLPRIKNDVTKNHYDAIFHVGDFAYDLHSANGTVGDMFMNLMEPIAANFSYMTCPGNHEYAYNFSNYRNRFSMPGDEYGEKMFYSFNIGPAHIISFSSEYYYFLQFGSVQMFNQYYWLMEDLEEASRPENRRRRPWIITMAHRPMYCSNSDSDDCTRRESLIRTGIPFFHILGLEKLFNSYGVDLMIWAHEHSYERLWPLYDRKVYNGTKSPYDNPPAPVHIITGSAGCDENLDPFLQKPADWSAFRADEYGYTRMLIQNKTHLHLEQVSDEKGGQIVDQIWLVRDKHGPFTEQGWRVVTV